MTEKTSETIEELRTLYTLYLKALCPDWASDRISAEFDAVFEEKDLSCSERRQQKFRASLLEKLQQIEKQPDDWFFTENSYRD